MTDASWGGAPPATSEFLVSNVLNRSIAIMMRNWLPFSLLAAVCQLPVLVLQLLFGDPNQLAEAARRGEQPDPALLLTSAGLALGFGLLAAFLAILQQAVILHGAFQDMRGRPVRLEESVRLAMGRLLPVFGLMVVMGLGVGFACLLLLVPGLMLAVAWQVALPACVVERLGPIRSLSRSAQLTKGHRWKLFGLMLVVILIGALAGGTVAGAALTAGRVPGLVLRWLVNAVVGAYGAIVAIVAYHDLRVVKEGIDTDRIAAVFD